MVVTFAWTWNRLADSRRPNHQRRNLPDSEGRSGLPRGTRGFISGTQLSESRAQPQASLDLPG
jgi:hypothetical protein